MFHTLLADDSPLFRRVVRNVLARHFPFMRISEAGDGEKALALGAERHPQLVFIDIKLPDGNGLEVARHFKSTLPATTVCIVAHYDILEYRIAAQQCGADHFIVKDESSEPAIVALVEKMIANRFRVLLVNHSEGLRKRVADLLTQRWPTMLIIDGHARRSTITNGSCLGPDAILFRQPILRRGHESALHAIRSHHPNADVVIITNSSLHSIAPPSTHSAFVICQNDNFADKLIAAMDKIIVARSLRA